MASNSNEVVKKVFRYSDIDGLPEELFSGDVDIDKKTGAVKGVKKPSQKKWTIKHNGIQFEVASKLQRFITKVWRKEDGSYRYDPDTLLKLCKEFDIPLEGSVDEKSGVFGDAPISELFMQKYNNPDIVINELDQETIDKRAAAFAHVMLRCFDEDVLKEIVSRATKKKNGSLYKGRVLTIARYGLVNYNGDTYVIVAKNDSDNAMTIEFRERAVNSTWYFEPDLFTTTKLFVEK